jgi:hypothetical protein
MHSLTKALLTTAFIGAMSGTAVAQTLPTGPEATNQNTKVYAYKKTAPAATPAPTMSAGPARMARDLDIPAHGSKKWWEEKNRYGHGTGE